MNHKKVLFVTLLGTALIISASSIFVSDSTAPTDATVVSSIESRLNNLVINDIGLSQSGGTYERSWSQPAAWSYYRFSVTNTTATKVTIQIQEHGNVRTYSLAAGKSDTWSFAGVSAGLHRIVVLTSDGRKFTGDITVEISDVAF